GAYVAFVDEELGGQPDVLCSPAELLLFDGVLGDARGAFDEVADLLHERGGPKVDAGRVGAQLDCVRAGGGVEVELAHSVPSRVVAVAVLGGGELAGAWLVACERPDLFADVGGAVDRRPFALGADGVQPACLAVLGDVGEEADGRPEFGDGAGEPLVPGGDEVVFVGFDAVEGERLAGGVDDAQGGLPVA